MADVGLRNAVTGLFVRVCAMDKCLREMGFGLWVLISKPNRVRGIS